ncbi:NAD-dependent protein deacetylase sirtuin-3, mitochondrial [Pelodytes ibericus]
MAMSMVCGISLKQIILRSGSACCVAVRRAHHLWLPSILTSPSYNAPLSPPYISSLCRYLHKSQVKSQYRFLSDRGGSNEGDTPLTLNDVAYGIKQGAYRRILVMVGAGISTDSGIPDFRSPTSGLYSKLKDYSLPYPEAIFDLSYFLREPHAFLHFSRELLPGSYKPNTAHYFLRLLNDKGLLLRLYTQNIDGLERVAGVPQEQLVEAHGSFSSATCTMCLTSYPGKIFQDAVFKSQVPICSSCGGLIKPDIVFFGEQLPPRFLMHLADFPVADLLVVIGTSLEVEPFASLVYAVKASTPRVLINRDPVGPFQSGHQGLNVMELGEVTAGIKHFAQLLGWEQELNQLEKGDVKD